MLQVDRGTVENRAMKQRVGHRISFSQRLTAFKYSFVRCQEGAITDATPRLVKFGAPAILLAVILAPSIWMLSSIPPLWRDVDAYVQLTRLPGFETILRYGPLYCFIARIPLYFGFGIDCLKASAPFQRLHSLFIPY